MIKQATIRFYAGLNDILPVSQRYRPVTFSFSGKPSIKDRIEAFGVPHTEVDLILINGQSVGFVQSLMHDDFVSIYPPFKSLDISPLLKLTAKPFGEPRFILDVHLGKLARKLRMLGFDTLYRNDYADPEIVAIALREQRIILTRDRGLLMIKSVQYGHWVRSNRIDEQVMEVLSRFDLYSHIRAFHRCINCNGMIQRTDKEAVIDLLLPRTALYYDEIYRCSGCDQLYWQGSHYQNMTQYIETLNDKISTIGRLADHLYTQFS